MRATFIRYQIVIEGEGKVYDGKSGPEARRQFWQLVESSKKRRSQRSITLFKDYVIVREHQTPAGEKDL
jgi:hypothetical protein